MNITAKDIDRNLPSSETLIATFYVTIPFDSDQQSLLPLHNMSNAPFQASHIPALNRNSELHSDNLPAVAIHVGRSALTYTSRDDMRMELGPGFGLVIGFTSVPRSEVDCCASNHIHVSSECHHTFPEIRELLRQMGSGLVVTK